MFPFRKKKNRLTPQQEKAEHEAINILNRAIKMLEKDPRNAEEAQRLRFEVTNDLLPKNKMYIIGKHPRSLLKELDITIQNAYVRQINSNGQLHHEEIPVVQSATTQRACDWWTNRYGMLKKNNKHQLYWAIAIFLAFTVFMVTLFFLMGSFGGNSSYTNSFKWAS
jgi:hypothetical protein